jgi:hypothetical protein
MNYEQPPRGRHAAEPNDAFPLPSAVLCRAEQLTTERIDRAHQQVGDALFAFLTLPDTNPASDHLEDDFHAAYRGDQATLDEAIHAQLNGLGWTDALGELLRENAIPENALVWDLDLIKSQMDEIYDFVEYNGRIYQFIK